MEPWTQTSKDSLQIPTKTKILSAELDVQLQPAEACDVTCVYSLSYSDAVVISEVLVVQLIGIAWNCTLQSTFKCQLDSLIISPFSAHANRPTKCAVQFTSCAAFLTIFPHLSHYSAGLKAWFTIKCTIFIHSPISSSLCTAVMTNLPPSPHGVIEQHLILLIFWLQVEELHLQTCSTPEVVVASALFADNLNRMRVCVGEQGEWLCVCVNGCESK